VFLDAVKVDLVCFFGRSFLVVLDVRGTKGYVIWENRLRPAYQEEGWVSGDRADLGSETPDDMWQLCIPSGRILRSFVEDVVFDGLEHHAIGSLDLAVAPWVGHRRVVDIDEAVLAKIPELRPCKGLSQVSDNPVGYPEPVGDVLDELCGLLRRDYGDDADLNSLGEFIHRYQDVLVSTGDHLERSHRVKAPYSKGPEQWNCP
jgi:hypothetical protein